MDFKKELTDGFEELVSDNKKELVGLLVALVLAAVYGSFLAIRGLVDFATGNSLGGDANLVAGVVLVILSIMVVGLTYKATKVTDGVPNKGKEKRTLALPSFIKPNPARVSKISKDMEEVLDGHVFLLAGTGMGKSVFATYLMLHVVDNGGQYVVVDGKPDNWNGKWPNAFHKVRNVDDYLELMQGVQSEMNRRIDVTGVQFTPLYMLIDEARTITGKDEDAVEIVSDIASRGRSVKVFVIVMSQTGTVAEVGFDGRTAILTHNFKGYALAMSAEGKRTFKHARFSNGQMIPSKTHEFATPHLTPFWEQDTLDLPVEPHVDFMSQPSMTVPTQTAVAETAVVEQAETVVSQNTRTVEGFVSTKSQVQPVQPVPEPKVLDTNGNEFGSFGGVSEGVTLPLQPVSNGVSQTTLAVSNGVSASVSHFTEQVFQSSSTPVLSEKQRLLGFEPKVANLAAEELLDTTPSDVVYGSGFLTEGQVDAILTLMGDGKASKNKTALFVFGTRNGRTSKVIGEVMEGGE